MMGFTTLSDFHLLPISCIGGAVLIMAISSLDLSGMQKQIEKWLKDPKDYAKGIELLEQVSRNKVLIANLARKENDRNLHKLCYELNKLKGSLSSQLTKKAPLKPKSSKAKTVASAKNAQNEPAAPETDQTLERLSEEKGMLHLERAREANRMKFCTNNEQRKQVYQNCLEIQDRYDAKAKEINHYLKHGHLPTAPPPKTTTFRLSDDPMDWRRQLQNARSNRSKLLKKIEVHAQDHPKQTIWKKKLNQISKDIEQIEVNIQSQKAANEAGLA